MRRLREVRASILRARLSLSAVSSSIELEAVLTSTPSFFSRSMTSWLGRSRSLASWKTLTLSIRLPSLARPVAGYRRCHGFDLGLGRLVPRRPILGLRGGVLRPAVRGTRLFSFSRRRCLRGRGFLGGGLLFGQAPRLFLSRRLLRGQPLRLEP